MLTAPLKYAFLNPDFDNSLYQHLLDHSSAHNVGDSERTRKAITPLVPSLKVANERGIPYIYLWASVNKEDERVVEDERKSEALERSIELIHAIREYVVTSNE